MVVVPADMPLTEPCAEPGMDVLEAGSVTVWLAAGGLPSFATLALPEVRVTFSEFARGIDVVTLIVPVPPACTETPRDGDKIMVGGRSDRKRGAVRNVSRAIVDDNHPVRDNRMRARKRRYCSGAVDGQRIRHRILIPRGREPVGRQRRRKRSPITQPKKRPAAEPIMPARTFSSGCG